MKPSSRNEQHKSERGAVMFLVAGTILVVMLAAALAVDLSVAADRGQNLQNAADAAALAGVQAYRESGGDETAARAAAAALMEQNGISPGGSTDFVVSFPDDENDTEVTVTVTDSEPDSYLGGITGDSSGISRAATARFTNCAADCSHPVEIPAPFKSVDTTGTGDGYKPIPVGTKLYALNHNNGYGGIVCIDRLKPDDDAWCWDSISKPAYASGADTQRNPEMPLTAVSHNTIFWTASNGSGTWLYCFHTDTAQPCNEPTEVSSRTRASSSHISNQKDRNRGGGTVLAAGKIFVFTDDHRVHCFVPAASSPLSRCPFYGNNGEAASLLDEGFPTNEPSDGNHGSSIDRTVYEVKDSDGIVTKSWIYWSIHVANGGPAPDAPVVCDTNQPNMEFPSGTVVIKSVAGSPAGGGLYVAINSGRDGIGNTTDPTELAAQWIVTKHGSGDDVSYSFKSATAGSTRVIDSDGVRDYSTDDDFERDLDVSDSVNTDDRWHIEYQDQTSRLRNRAEDYFHQPPDGWDDYPVYMVDNGKFQTGIYADSIGDWVIRPWQCEDASYVNPSPDASADLSYSTGTYLQCWDALLRDTCTNFEPSRIHANGERFSGRLFPFYGVSTPSMDPEIPDIPPVIEGICSGGYANDSTDTDQYRIRCVDYETGETEPQQNLAMGGFAANIVSQMDNSPAAWGDPHYNAASNRVFFPSAHDHSFVYCWDFDYGYCQDVQGYSPTNGYVEDYGFFCEGDCVYGLGHTAVFWAFKATSIDQKCTGSGAQTQLRPCDCAGDWEWGKLRFTVDLTDFVEFNVRIEDRSGVQIYPPLDPLIENHEPWHSLHLDGTVIDLNKLGANIDDEDAEAGDEFLTIIVETDAIAGSATAEDGNSFVIEFDRAPRLTE